MRYALSEIPAGTGAAHHYRITGSHENRPESSEQADCKIQSSTIHFLLEPFMLKMQHPIKNKMFLSNAVYYFYAYSHVLGTFLGTFAKI